MKVDTYNIDNKEYGIIHTIKYNNEDYCFLLNVSNNKDLCIRKYKIVNNETYFSKLEEDEFKTICSTYMEEIKNLLNKQ